MVPFQKRVKYPQQKWYHFSQKIIKNTSTKMVPFQKRVKIPQQKWYHFRRGSKFLNKNGTISGRKGSKFLYKKCTISEKGQNSSAKMVQFQKRVKHRQQKWYQSTSSEKSQNSSRKMVPFQKRVKNPRQKMVPFQSEKGQNSLTKNVPFQKRVKIPQQKWNNFRRGSNIVNKNGTSSEKSIKSSTKTGGGGCRYFFDGTYADFSKFLKITTHPPPSRME